MCISSTTASATTIQNSLIAISLYCRRAAHFATFQAGDDDAGQNNADNPHVGADNARSLGPWSTAVQLANARETELQRRNEKIKDANDAQNSNGAPIWQPSRDVKLGPRPRGNVPPLLTIALELVANYIEDVESLYGLPELVKSRIASVVCRQRAMSPTAFKLFCTDSAVEVSVPNCTAIEPETMQEGIAEVWTPRLEKLILGLCGRGFTDAVVTTLAGQGASLPALRSLTISGAYRLGDDSLSALLKKAPKLTSLALPQCSRLTGDVVKNLPESLPLLEEIDLSECRGIGGDVLKSSLSSLPLLRCVTLDALPEVDDAIVAALASGCKALDHLSLCRCAGVTDKSLEALAKHRPTLSGLRIDECKVTDSGIVALLEGCRQVHVLSLGGCARLTDVAISAIANAGCVRQLCLNSVTQLTDAGLQALALHCSSTLQELDVSWCRGVSAAGVGYLVDTCRGSLKRLSAWGCTQLDEAFLYGHSNDDLEVIGRGEELQPVVLPFA